MQSVSLDSVSALLCAGGLLWCTFMAYGDRARACVLQTAAGGGTGGFIFAMCTYLAREEAFHRRQNVETVPSPIGQNQT